MRKGEMKSKDGEKEKVGYEEQKTEKETVKKWKLKQNKKEKENQYISRY